MVNQSGAERSNMRDTHIDKEAGHSFWSWYKTLMGILHHLQSIVAANDDELVLLFDRLGSEELALELCSRKIEDCIRARTVGHWISITDKKCYVANTSLSNNGLNTSLAFLAKAVHIAICLLAYSKWPDLKETHGLSMLSCHILAW